jgi:hypothetical protein
MMGWDEIIATALDLAARIARGAGKIATAERVEKIIRDDFPTFAHVAEQAGKDARDKLGFPGPR